MNVRVELQSFFPNVVAFAELPATATPEPLFPEEQVSIGRAVEKRKREFTLGRACARKALAALGVPPVALPMNPDRSVTWPEAAWGTITHSDNFYAAAAVLRQHARGLGIDAEVRGRVAPNLWSHIATEREIDWFRAAGDAPAANERATMLFSAKEAFYKAQFCVSRAWVGFHDAQLTFDDAGEFEVELLVDVAQSFVRGTRFRGRYTLLSEHVLTHLLIGH